MLKSFLVTLLALHCTCQEVVEVTDPKVQTISATHLPLRSWEWPVKHHNFAYSPVGYGYGMGDYHGLNAGYHGLNAGYHGLNAGYRALNIAPSPYSYLPFQSGLTHSYLHSQPIFKTSTFAQPIVSNPLNTLAIPQHTTVAVTRPHVSVAVRPQMLTHQQTVHPVNAAIQQVGRTVEYRAVPYNDQPIVAQDIVVEPSDQPINIHFRSQSSTVRLTQEHIPGEPGTVEQTQSQDEPSKVVHEVVKPVIQEVREVIQPYRQITQEVQPVVENVHKIVTHGEGVREQYVAEPVIKQHVQPISVQPVQHMAVHRVAVAQPVAQTVVRALPQIHNFHVVPHLQNVQPVMSVAQPYHVRAIAQPSIGFGHHTVVAQPVHRLVAANQQPIYERIFRSELRDEVEVQPKQHLQPKGDFVKYAESE